MFWCSNTSLYTLVLRWGFLFSVFLVNYADCKEKKSHPEDSASPSAINTAFDHHTHSKWDIWTAPSQDRTKPLPWDQQDQMPNIVPLTIQEQRQRQKKSKSNSHKSKKSSLTSHHHQSHNDESKGAESKSSEKPKKGKTDNPEASNTSSEDLSVIREKALNFGKLVINFLAQQVLAPPEDLREPRDGRSFSSPSFQQAQERQEGGEGEGNRNRVIDWVSRLIGVQGKTLGEFLREYQVHVLYDLVFTFFKWIFFLYAGLLIP